MLRLDTDVFFVKGDHGRAAVFAPLRGIIGELPPILAEELEGGASSVASPQLAAYLYGLELLVKSDSVTQPPAVKADGVFKPRGVVFMVTSACNLRCEYCYAEAGDHAVEPFDHQMALDAAKLCIDNAVEMGVPDAYLSFHGGGEPSLDFGFIRHVVEASRAYARDVGDTVRVITSMVTNGVMSRRRLEWVAQNIDSVQVSYDGPDEIHNRQRPTLRGGASAHLVREAIKFLEGRVPDLLIKSTISAYSVHYMPEIVEHLCSTFALKRFHLGPVLGAGRGRFPEYGEPDPEAFVYGYYRAQEIAARHGATIVVSQVEKSFPNVRRTYCGVTDPNFVLTQNGDISSCYEIMSRKDPRSSEYFYGSYNRENRSFEVDEQAIKAARTRDVNGLTTCRQCFAKWQCAGDCQARWLDDVTGFPREKADIRCKINRELVRRRIFAELDRQHSAGIDCDGI